MWSLHGNGVGVRNGLVGLIHKSLERSNLALEVKFLQDCTLCSVPKFIETILIWKLFVPPFDWCAY